MRWLGLLEGYGCGRKTVSNGYGYGMGYGWLLLKTLHDGNLVSYELTIIYIYIFHAMMLLGPLFAYSCLLNTVAFFRSLELPLLF